MPHTVGPKTEITVEEKVYPLKQAFKISRGAKTEARVLEVRLKRGDHLGRGETVPYPRYDETSDSVMRQIGSVSDAISRDMDRIQLLSALPAGAARCAIDLALWDLEAREQGQPVWELAGLPQPKPILCTETLSLDAPDIMAAAARDAKSSLLKLKLGGPGDMDRVAAVHEARPDAKLILDGNEGVEPEGLASLTRAAAGLGVVLIEQPLPAGKDDALIRSASPVAICADESAHTSDDLDQLARRYDAVNVKLGKAGGLTAALDMVRMARLRGLHVMMGCMVGSSLSMAPAVLLAQICDAADLDGPLWLAQDVPHGLIYEDGQVHPPSGELWGG